MMDYGTLRGFFALLILAIFIVIVIWSYSKKRQSTFDEAAKSILAEDVATDHPQQQAKQETKNNV
jgi:cytochrome c oxidase cbb3-type subunit IV